MLLRYHLNELEMQQLSLAGGHKSLKNYNKSCQINCQVLKLAEVQLCIWHNALARQRFEPLSNVFYYHQVPIVCAKGVTIRPV